jgi:hypothetical protein
MVGSYTMDTTRLQELLGTDYPNVIRYTVADALADSFRASHDAPQPAESQSVVTGA